mgnify:CR=1 FL=1
MTKVEINLKLEGKDAMRVIRAIVDVDDKHSEKKVKKPSKTKKKSKESTDNRIVVRPSKVSGKPENINGKKVIKNHKVLAMLWTQQKYTAKEAAKKAGVTVQTAYSFANKHGVKWLKYYGKRK